MATTKILGTNIDETLMDRGLYMSASGQGAVREFIDHLEKLWNEMN